jgi:2,4-dienoyl-CoA reductase-like NADH-dependent reductase (Old Yellow Enzyme family)/thioredoxin reductase
MTYPQLFQPGQIGVCELRNRIIMPLYPAKYSVDSTVNERMLAFYRERARGGVALIVLDCPCLDYPSAYKGKNELRMDEPHYVEGLKRLVRTIHDEGTKAFMHLNYPSERFVDEGTKGAKQKKGKWVLPLMNNMTIDEAYEIINKISDGAAKAREIGYDGVEIQAGYGDLISQILSPLTNKRDDELGGSLENRTRFLVELTREIKRRAGDDFPIMVKLCCNEYVEGGITIEDSKIIAKMIEGAGADAIIANAGNKATKYITIPCHDAGPGTLAHLSKAIKDVVNIPVIAIGKINTPELAEEIIFTEKADFVAMARALIADPYLPRKAMEGRIEEIRGCIYCLEDCAQSGVKGLGRACSVNPFSGQEHILVIRSADKRKRVVVVGGGPAGLQASILLSERGHDVILFEKSGSLGGQFLLADRAPYKSEVRELLRYLDYMLSINKVKVILNREATIYDIMAENPDAAIIATGSKPRMPVIPGINLPHVYNFRDVYENRCDIGKRIVIIGGGDIGCETADMLASEGRQVTIIEILPQVLGNMKDIPRQTLLGRLGGKGVKILTETEVVLIEKSRVWIRNSKAEEYSLNADSVVVAIGSEPEVSLKEPLINRGLEAYTIGDAECPGNVGSALRTATTVALKL